MSGQISITQRNKLLRFALLLSLITIFYNIAEGLLSVYFGVDDESLALFGFGIDSFVEVISGTGITHMVWRMKKTNIEESDVFERRALRITGFSFYLLTLGLVIGAVLNIINKSTPETTVAGIVISAISILTMYFLLRYKLKAGKALDSDAIIADAHCTRTCFYLSLILLISSILYEIFHIAYFDVAGSLGIAFFTFHEGKEAFDKARHKLFCTCKSLNP